MSEVISVFVGGAGVRIGKECIELNAKEHGLSPDGFFIDEERATGLTADGGVNHGVHFREDSLSRWTPRSIFFDCESE